MILTIAMFVVFQLNFTETIVDLKKTPKREIPRFMPANVSSDGSVTVTTQTRFWHWSIDGELIRSVTVSSKPGLKLFMDVHFDAEHNIYWIANLEGKAVILSSEGKILSPNVPIPTSKHYKNLSYRFLIPSKNFTFGVAKGFDSLIPSRKAFALTPLMIEGELTSEKTQVRAGTPFSELNELHRQTQYNYKEHWVIYDAEADGYYIMSAMSRFIRFFKNRGSLEEPQFIEVLQRPFFKTDDFIVPDLTAPRRISSSQELIDWLNLFPRITGFYPFGDDFLICYRIPSPSGDGKNRQILHRLDKNGGLVGKLIESEAKVIGAHNESVYTLERGEYGLRLKLLKFE